MEVRLLLRALDRDMANAWREAFDDIASVDIQVGDILKAAADAIVSPSNSFGYMDGGIDGAYRGFFGTGVGGMNYARAARQMAAAYHAVVLGEWRHLPDARSVWRHHHELLR